MRIINTAKDNPAILDVMGRLAFYSGMDNLTLFEIRDGLTDLMDDNRRATYNFEMELQAALLEMSFNGIPVDQAVRNDLKREFTGIVLDLTAFLNEMLEKAKNKAFAELNRCLELNEGNAAALRMLEELE